MKFVLLSFQGMVFCNNFIKSIIQMSANSYLANHFGVDYSTASSISYHFQKTIGHPTKIIDDSVETLNDYNYHVFSKLTNDEISKYITKEDISHVEHLLTLKNTLNIDYILCTNLPLIFCIRVFNAMNISLFKLFNPNYIFTSDIIGYVKEDPEYFKYVQTKLQNANLTSCIYIDNNEFNIKSEKKLNATIFSNIVLLLDSNELVDCIVYECL